jgi:HSP20 family molecular chaperone IbpA
MPGLDAKPLLAELRDRVAEELDYRLEAAAQEAFAVAYAGAPDVWVPQVFAVTGHVLVSEWMDGIPLARIIASGTIAERDRAGVMIARFLFSGPAQAGLLHADPHPGNFRLLADGRLGVLDFGAVDRLPDGLPPLIGKLLRLMHDDADLDEVEDELRSHGFLRDGVSIDLAELRAFLAPLAEPSRAETFRFTREWLRGEAMRVARMRSSSVLRRVNLPPFYVLIHRVSTAGIGVLCQLECEGPFCAEMLRWLPGYADPPTAAPQPQPARPTWPASPGQPTESVPRAKPAPPARSARPARPEQITWAQVKWEDLMAKLPRPQTPAVFRAMFPDLADWLESPWTGPPPFLVAQAFRVEVAVQDDRYVIRAELPGLDPDKDIEVTVDGRTLTIRAERRQEDNGPYRSEFRYGSFTRSVRLPAKVDANDVTARYDKGVLEVTVPVREATPVGTQVPIETVTAGQKPPGRQEPAEHTPAAPAEGAP